MHFLHMMRNCSNLVRRDFKQNFWKINKSFHVNVLRGVFVTTFFIDMFHSTGGCSESGGVAVMR